MAILILLGCKQQVITINGLDYQQQDTILTQLTKTNKSFSLFGILSDIHGNINNTAYFVQYFVDKGVDGFLLSGDIVDHFRNDVPDEKELTDVLTVVSEPGLPVFIIPGNHETKDVYNNVLGKLKRKNIIDMTKIRRADLEQVVIISLPGYNVPGFVADGGFLFGDEEWQMLRNLADVRKKKILLSHQLPKSTRRNGIDIAFGGKHAGDGILKRIMEEEKIDIAVGSHIHESGGQAETRNDIFVPQNTYSETLYLNPGSVTSWRFINQTKYKGLAAVLSVNETHAAYKVVAIV